MSQIDPQIIVSGKQQILFDAQRVAEPVPEMFDPEHWRTHGAIEGDARGRGTTYFIRFSDQRWVLRHYRRGGLIARFLKDRYLGLRPECSRSFREWQLLVELYRIGMPVPRPIAASVIRHGLHYSADIITERLEGSSTLADRLKEEELPLAGWEVVGDTVRRLHDANCFHADLNAMNILLMDEGEVFLIDFDRACFKRDGAWKASNLQRLHRSLVKLGGLNPGFNFNSACWQALLTGYYR